MKYDSMDRHNGKNELYSTNGGYDLNEVLGGNVKRKVARRRWGILAKALKSPTGSEPTSPTDEFSLRRISSFMLLTTQEVPCERAAKNRAWYRYSMSIDGIDYSVVVGHRTRTFSAEDLMGFNNTGNVCIWPSEETLAYYVGSNLHVARGKSVLELGGGMSCLAGLYLAKYGGARRVALTDGNRTSVENVRCSLECNEFGCPVDCFVLKWGDYSLDDRFDLVLCADCLFFDEARADLIETLWDLLAPDGLALVMAPKRGATLDNFVNQSRTKGFRCEQRVNYNSSVWERHISLMNNCDYDDNIHYPVLIELTKI